MSRWTSAVGSGLAAAVVAGFLYWWLDGMHQVNGIGLLGRQGWPVNSPWMWGAAGFVVGSVVGLVQGARRVGYARDARELAEELGRKYEESYSLPPGACAMPIFAGWSEGRHAMTSGEDALSVALFDFAAVREGSESAAVSEGTAALLPVDGLTTFDLRPRTLGRRVLGWAGFEGLTFDPRAADPADTETVRRFTEGFQLFAGDPISLIATLSENGPVEADGREDALRRLFTPAVMEVVNQYPAYAIQSRPGFLAVWRGAGILPVRKRAELWDAAVHLRSLLTRPPERGAGPVVPGRVGTEANRQARRLRNTLVGGVIGLFVGFILAAMTFSIVFFRQVPGLGQGPGLGFLVTPLLLVGFTMVGAAVGAGIGSRMPIRDLPPGLVEDPARRKARQRAAVCATTVGTFGGFFVGFVAFAASKLLLNWKLDDFGVESAIFFGSIFGGALLGAVTCGMVVDRIYRLRSPGKPSP